MHITGGKPPNSHAKQTFTYITTLYYTYILYIHTILYILYFLYSHLPTTTITFTTYTDTLKGGSRQHDETARQASTTGGEPPTHLTRLIAKRNIIQSLAFELFVFVSPLFLCQYYVWYIGSRCFCLIFVFFIFCVKNHNLLS